MKRVLVFVPDGVGIRNYLYSDVFKSDGLSVSLLHDFDERTLNDLDLPIALCDQERIADYKEGLWEKFLRELIHRCRLKYNCRIQQNPTIMKFWKGKTSGLLSKVFYSAVILIGGMVRKYRSILLLEKYYYKAVRSSDYFKTIKEQLGRIDPDILFCTHQRALKATAVFLAAEDLNIESISVIYSWDNLPKARLPFRADRFLLWSEIMREQMSLFYPDIQPERLLVSGTPQFEFYEKDEFIIPRDDFYPRFGLDPTRRIICFSGDDIRTSPQDPLYLRDLAEEIRKNELGEYYQVVFRRCPVDLSDRYDEVLKEYDDIIVNAPPMWRTNDFDWSAVYPQLEDVRVLVSLAYYGELVVNVGSTMAFDFGMFNKPCIFINYDQPGFGDWSTRTIYQYEHFRSMPSDECVWWCNSKDDFAVLLTKRLDGKMSEIKAWYELINKDGASENIQKLLLS